jgi:hypothetical protein
MSSPHYSGNPSDPLASTSASSEEELRKKLLAALQSLTRREPLDATYQRLLTNGAVTRRSPVIPKDPLYKRMGSRLRERVGTYLQEMQGKDPFDRISQRKPMEEASMRAAFTLREAKKHEQKALLDATLAAKELDPTRKQHLEGIALELQSRKEKKMISNLSLSTPSMMEQTEQARQKADLERQRAQARKREDSRRRREEDERRRKEEELTRKKSGVETPQQALHKAMEPVFKKFWDMEFVNLGSTNPFRIVIDRENCASIGAADYFDVITIPMNLKYIQDKVNKLQYTSFKEFFADVDLMISNAILYNSDPSNPYRIAAEEMKRRHQRIVKKVYQQIEQKRQAQNK